jgi:hypothetical protein
MIHAMVTSFMGHRFSANPAKSLKKTQFLIRNIQQQGLHRKQLNGPNKFCIWILHIQYWIQFKTVCLSFIVRRSDYHWMCSPGAAWKEILNIVNTESEYDSSLIRLKFSKSCHECTHMCKFWMSWFNSWNMLPLEHFSKFDLWPIQAYLGYCVTPPIKQWSSTPGWIDRVQCDCGSSVNRSAHLFLPGKPHNPHPRIFLDA